MKHINRDTLRINHANHRDGQLYPASVVVTVNGVSTRVPAQIAEDGCISAFGLNATITRDGKSRSLPAVIYEWENLDGTIDESAAYGSQLGARAERSKRRRCRKG
jgi:hypothetical protein